MFWDKSYTPSQNIEALLQKEDVTVEELLDDEDILQECKVQKRALIQYLTRPDVIKRLVELIITEPPENLSVAQRFKHSNTACEILTFGLPSLDEKLVEEPTILQTLYSFLKQEPPLNPLLSSYFSKTFSMLISKKSEQDWFLYQRMCLQVLEFIKSQNDFIDLILKHFATPVIMDLLLQIIKEVQGGALKKDLYEWLAEQKLVERLIKLLGDQDEVEKHNNISEFLCDLIRHGRSMRQSDENDSYEPIFVGSNPILLVLENKNTIELLLDVMLTQPPKESSVTSGVSIILTLVDETIVEEPASDQALQNIIDREKENHEKIVSTVIQAISPKLKDFHELLVNPPEKNDVVTTVAQLSPPFGITRLQTCRLFTVLLRTGNINIINAICEIDFFNTLLKLFKQYMWNNFLHSEVEKCLKYVFTNFDQNDNEKSFDISPSALQTHVIVNCKIIPKLLDCWMHNTEVESTNGRRLGYMGHLIKIFENVNLCVTKSDHIGALIVSNLTEKELEDWKRIMDSPDGELSKELQAQKKFLADCDPCKVENVFDASLPKDFGNENCVANYHYDFTSSNFTDALGEQNSPGGESALIKLCEYIGNDDVMNCIFAPSDDIALNLQRQLKVWGSNSEDILGEDNMDYDPFTEAMKQDQGPFNVSISPWGTDAFSADSSTSGWADFSSNNFADFDAHFNSFANDLGDKIETTSDALNTNLINDKSDNNANIKSIFDNKSDDNDEINIKNAKNLNINFNQNDDFNDDNRFDSQNSGSDTVTDTKCISVIGDNKTGDDLRQESVQNTLKNDCVDDRVTVTNGPNNDASNEDKITQNELAPPPETSVNLSAASSEETTTKLENRNEITDKDMENIASSILSTSTEAVDEPSEVLENGPV